MKALTICQPYAELIARGDKPIENRTWPTAYRGPLLIHAGKSRAWLDDPLWLVKFPDMSFGAIVAVAELVACLEFYDGSGGETWPRQWQHLRDHEHANGPWCWMLENVRRLATPVPYRGAQGLFDVELAKGTHFDAIREFSTESQAPQEPSPGRTTTKI